MSDAQGLAAGKTPKSVSNTVFVLFYSTQGFGGVDLLCSKISLGQREFFVVLFWVGIDIACSGGKNSSEVLEPIQKLTCKEVPWQWQHEHDAAFEKVRPCDTSTLVEVLQPYRGAHSPMTLITHKESLSI